MVAGFRESYPRDREHGGEFGHQFWPTLATRFGPLIKQNRVALFWLACASWKELPVGLESQSGTIREDPARVLRGRRNDYGRGPQIGSTPADGARSHPECNPTGAPKDPAPANSADLGNSAVH